MKRVNNYLRKKVLVLGLAKSGVAAAKLLHRLGAFVTVNDIKLIEENPDAQVLLADGMVVICGDHPVGLLDEGFEFVVKNPGIPYHNVMIKRALELNIPVITEVELAYQISEAPIIGITGTNGKTTTTTLIFEILQAGKKNPLIAGNIGTVACEVTQKAKEDNVIVMELSSFQLLGIEKFRPKIAVLTNLFDAHLDYHGSKSEYFQAKQNILKNQTPEDYLVFNGGQSEFHDIVDRYSAKPVPFGIEQSRNNLVYVKDQAIYFQDEKVIDIAKIILPGVHNLENILAAIAVAKLLGVDHTAIEQVLTTFQGVEHRMQFVRELDNRKFYNDSKATNILATTRALESFNTPTILLAGGLDRGNEFDELIPYLKNIKVLITFGEAAQKLARVAKDAGVSTIEFTDNVETAVPLAYQLSHEGDTILLSPACASWDQYQSFEVRGDIFAGAVHRL